MLSLVLTSSLCLAVTGFAVSYDDCQANALIEKWDKAADRLGALSAASREAISGARARLSASCPVCQETPATFALIGRFLDATVALDGRILDAVERNYRAEGPVSAPAEVRTAFEQRIAIGARARDLFAAFSRGMASLDRATAPPSLSQCSPPAT